MILLNHIELRMGYYTWRIIPLSNWFKHPAWIIPRLNRVLLLSYQVALSPLGQCGVHQMHESKKFKV
jgi:hypothetical protein